MNVVIDKLSPFQDSRGMVYEPVDLAQLANTKNAHVALTQPGCIRGNHFHRRATEILIAHGPALIRYQEPTRHAVDHHIPDGEVHRLTFPPGVAHAIQNTGSHPQLLVAFTDQPHDPNRPDTTPCALIPSKGSPESPGG